MRDTQHTVERREPAEEIASGGPRWYACYTRARHEKRVAAHLEERGFEVFLPLIPRERQWHDRTRTVRFPLFPGYVFCRFGLDRIYWVADAPGVATVVHFNGSPAPIADDEIRNIRRFARAVEETGIDTTPEPLPELEEGQPVRVVAGPFRGIEGTVVEQRSGGRMLIQIGLRVIGQGVKIEADGRSLKKIEPVH